MESILDKLRFARGCITLEAESKQQAKNYVTATHQWAKQFQQDIFVFYPGCKNPYKIPANTNIQQGCIMSQLIIPDESGYVIAKTQVTPTLHRAIAFFLENPEVKGGVVRLTDERQIVMSRASASLVKSASLEQAVERKRSDYWYLEDLHTFNSIFTPQALEPNNPDSKREYSFRIYDPVTRDNWRQNVNEYRLIQDEMGVFYHLFTNLGYESIPSLVGAMR